jgi:hypothetical protein
MKALYAITGSGWAGDADKVREGWGFEEER